MRGYIEIVSEYGRAVYRVVFADGRPLRECNMCGLGITIKVVEDHARIHGVYVSGAPRPLAPGEDAGRL